MQAILKKEGVHYQTSPVLSYAEVYKAFQENQLADSEVRSKSSRIQEPQQGLHTVLLGCKCSTWGCCKLTLPCCH